MKSALALTIAFCLLSIVLLGAFAMHYGNGMLRNGCFAAMNAGIPCAQRDWALADFHISGLKMFSLAVIVFAALAAIIFIVRHVYRERRSARLSATCRALVVPVLSYPAPRALISWIALKVHSPSLA